MAAVKWSVRAVKAGVRVEGRVRLSCGHTIKEYATARTEESGKKLVQRLLAALTSLHMKECRDK